MANDKPYVLDVYRAITEPRRYKFDNLPKAIKFGETIWQTNKLAGGSIYKMKLWDLTKGPIEPNKPNAAGLFKEWI